MDAQKTDNDGLYRLPHFSSRTTIKTSKHSFSFFNKKFWFNNNKIIS